MPKPTAAPDPAKPERKPIPIGYTIDARSVNTDTSDISGPTVEAGRGSIAKNASAESSAKKQEGKPASAGNMQLQDQYIQFRPTREDGEEEDAVVTAGIAGRKTRVSRLESSSGVSKRESEKTYKDWKSSRDQNHPSKVLKLPSTRDKNFKTPSKPINHPPLPGRPADDSPTSVLDLPETSSRGNPPPPPVPPPPPLLSEKAVPPPSKPMIGMLSPPEAFPAKPKTSRPPPKKDDSVVYVEIQLAPKSETLKILTVVKFTLSAQNVEAREEEMRSMANDALIPPDRWDGSLIYRKWKPLNESKEEAEDLDDAQESQNAQQKQLVNNVKILSNHVSIEPPPDIQASWNDDFLTSLKTFYDSGTVHVPDSSNGRDLLILLEFFGIVHAPNKVTYESYGAYMRMKLWSEYLSRRSDMAMYVIHRCMSRSKLQHAFVTTTDPAEGTAGTVHYVDGRICDVFDGGFQVLKQDANGSYASSCSVVYDFFNDESEQQPRGGDGEPDTFAKTLRADFAEFLEKSLPGTQVSFEILNVKLKTKSLMVSLGPRAVLSIEPQTANTSSDPKNNVKKNTDAKKKVRMFGAPDDSSTESLLVNPAAFYAAQPNMNMAPSPFPGAMHPSLGHSLQFSTQTPQMPQMTTMAQPPVEDNGYLYSRFVCADQLHGDDNIEACNALWLGQCFDVCSMFPWNKNQQYAAQPVDNFVTLDAETQERQKASATLRALSPSGTAGHGPLIRIERTASTGSQNNLPLQRTMSSVSKSKNNPVPFERTLSSASRNSGVPLERITSSASRHSGVPIERITSSASKKSGAPIERITSSASRNSRVPILRTKSSVSQDSDSDEPPERTKSSTSHGRRSGAPLERAKSSGSRGSKTTTSRSSGGKLERSASSGSHYRRPSSSSGKKSSR